MSPTNGAANLRSREKQPVNTPADTTISSSQHTDMPDPNTQPPFSSPNTSDQRLTAIE
ncbi:hypothetical protein K439DRAFT_1663914, partial [Ramaria rubella]